MSITSDVDRTEIVQLKESLERTQKAEERERRLREIDRRLAAEGQSLPGVARAALETLTLYLGFERGFLLLAGPARGGRDREGMEGEASPFRVLAARRRREGKDEEFEDVPNPEFAVNHSAVKSALESAEVLALNDCLVQPRHGAEVHRSVLCQHFIPAPGTPAVIYLDRALGGDPVLPVDLSLLSDFTGRCVQALIRSILCQEVVELRSKVALLEAEGPRPVPASGTPPEGAAEEERSVISPAEIPSYHGIVGGSEKLRKIFQIIEKIKDSDLSICIFGESGTGKELVARAIHASSRRREKKFVSENCGTIAENLLESELFGHMKGAFTGADEDRVGLFEAAQGGTLFLDEIGDMSEGMQRKLLRVLQEGVIRPIGSRQTMKVDARIISASNRNLPSMVQSGQFRVDLFYRINVISIELPPLRDRTEDIPILGACFLNELAREDGQARRISESAMNAFGQYAWPGNVRELRNVIRRAAVTSSRRTITRKDVAPLLVGGQASGLHGEDLDRSETQIVIRIPRRKTFNEIIGECERVVLRSALKECRWNKSKVVKMLKIPRQSLYNMITKHDLTRKWET